MWQRFENERLGIITLHIPVGEVCSLDERDTAERAGQSVDHQAPCVEKKKGGKVG